MGVLEQLSWQSSYKRLLTKLASLGLFGSSDLSHWQVAFQLLCSSRSVHNQVLLLSSTFRYSRACLSAVSSLPVRLEHSLFSSRHFFCHFLLIRSACPPRLEQQSSHASMPAQLSAVSEQVLPAISLALPTCYS